MPITATLLPLNWR